MIGEAILIVLAMMTSIGLVSFARFNPRIINFIRRKSSDEITLMKLTVDEKKNELKRQRTIENLSEEIECLDEHLYSKEKGERREALNDVSDDGQIQRDGEAIRRGFGGVGMSIEDLDKHNEASVSVIGPMQYLEKATAYAGGVVVEASTTYPKLKTIGGNEMKKEEMNEEDVEYFEQLELKDQAVRTMRVVIDNEPVSKNMLDTCVNNGMNETKAMLSTMEFIEKTMKKK